MDLRQSQEPESFVVIDEALTIESIGEDLSLEEAVGRVKDLTRQNEELRRTVDSNSKIMKQQIQVLSEWKANWEADKAEVVEMNEQARTVVSALRADVAKKDAKIEQLNSTLDEIKDQASITPATVEQQDLQRLQSQLDELNKVIGGLKEENGRLTSSKDDVCRELDQHTKIVAELQTEKTNLLEENKALQQDNDKLTHEVKSLIEKSEKTNAEKQELTDHNEKLKGYILVGEVSAEEVVTDAAIAPHLKTESSGPLSMDKNMADLMTQLQELRTENSELKQNIQNRTQEMEALHRKVHTEAERLVNSEHEHRQAVNLGEAEHQHVIEQLNAELTKLKSQQSPRGSLDGSMASVEEVKSLKTQVISLGNELDSSNAKLKGTEELYEKQKERMQALEVKLRTQHADAEQDRSKADELITKLQQSLTSLETFLANEKRDNAMKTNALAENRKKFAQLLNDYHSSMGQAEEYKKQLDEIKTGGGYQQDKVDNLLAQLMAADESLRHKADEISKLRREKDEVMAEYDRINQILPVLKAQCDIFKNDFEAERTAREKIHRDKEDLREEYEHIHGEKIRLEDEIQRLSSMQLQAIRERNSVAPLNRQASPSQSRNFIPQNIAPAATPAPPRQEAHEDVRRCPLCQTLFPDSDTLQLHVHECLDQRG